MYKDINRTSKCYSFVYDFLLNNTISLRAYTNINYCKRGKKRPADW